MELDDSNKAGLTSVLERVCSTLWTDVDEAEWVRYAAVGVRVAAAVGKEARLARW